MRQLKRTVKIGNITIGGTNPIAVQTMLNVPVKDIAGNVEQAKRVAKAGCQIVRVTVPTPADAAVVSAIKEAVDIPVVADIHFDYRAALAAIDAGADKIRINPGNIGDDDRVKAVADACNAKNIPIRIGVNGGSLEKHILARYGAPVPEAMVESAMYHVRLLEKHDFNNIVISIKSSNVPRMMAAYRLLASQTDYPLHVGVTEAGGNRMGLIKSGMGIGIGIMIVLMIVVIVLAHKEQWPKDEIHFNLKEFCISFLKAIPALMLPIIILGGIYSGLLTATESSAIAVVWSFIAGMFIYRELKWSDLFDIFVDSAKSSAMTLFIIATSTAFAWLFAYAGISTQLVDFVVGMHLSATMYCLVVAVILLIFGTFLEGIATAVLLVPVLWPVAQALGVNVIHFGMIVSIANVVGTMTPPVAVNIFSAASVTKLSMGKIVHGQWPFFIGYVGFFFLVVFIPALSTFLL